MKVTPKGCLLATAVGLILAAALILPALTVSRPHPREAGLSAPTLESSITEVSRLLQRCGDE